LEGATDTSIEARTIEGVRNSTRYLLKSFKGKADELKKSGSDIQKLIRFGVDPRSASAMAREFFGRDRVEYLAIDGTQGMDEELDLLVFYVASFGYSGTLSFREDSIEVGDPVAVKESFAVSAAIPIYAEHGATVSGRATESGTEFDAERLPNSLMHLAEYYVAVKAIAARSAGVILLDRPLAGDVSHLVWSTRDLVRSRRSVLLGMQTELGPVADFDLELARILVPDAGLGIPAPRSHLLKYAAISSLFDGRSLDLPSLLAKMGASPQRLSRLKDDFDELQSEFEIFEEDSGKYRLKPGVKDYWGRVVEAALAVADNVFRPAGSHPLRVKVGAEERWVTADDLDYLVLIVVYELTRRAWSDKILPIGLVKDSGASELVRTVVPVLDSSGLAKLSRKLPEFNSDKMLLQTDSVVNAATMPTPWRTVDIDAAFRTMVPVEDAGLLAGEARVRGAYGNVVYPERMYVKNYIQLWRSKNEPSVRSHVFAFDRPAYRGYDRWDNLVLRNKDDSVDEEIRPVLNLGESRMTNLVMTVLLEMSREVIPEALGHNYPLFLADKKAKFVLRQNREAYMGAVAVEMARSDLDQQVLFSQRFRDYRGKVESERKRR